MSAESELAGLCDAGVVVLTSPIHPSALSALTAREHESVARAVDKRKHEFATGRMLARRALARLGRPEAEILSAPDRAPIWPEGIRGSISHCHTRAVVAVTDRPCSIGVDVEHRGELRRELWSMVFGDEEVRRLEADFAPAERARRALVLFSAKEALYKAQYVWSRSFLGFHDVSVAFNPNDSGALQGSFECCFEKRVTPFARGATASGRYRFDAFPEGEVVTAIQLERMATIAGRH